MTSEQQLTPVELYDVYRWIDAVPMSKQKKNITRDFSDGVAVAKLVQYYLPKMPELQIHNYIPSLNSPQKRVNWEVLNKKVFTKLNLKLDEKLVESVIDAKPGAIELILFDLKKKVMEMSPLAMSQTTLMAGQAQGGQSVFKRTRSHHPSRPLSAAPAFTSVAAIPPQQRQGRALPPRPASAKLSVSPKVNSRRATAPPPPILRKRPAAPVKTEVAPVKTVEAVPEEYLEFSLTSKSSPEEDAQPKPEVEAPPKPEVEALPKPEVEAPPKPEVDEPTSPPPTESAPSEAGDTNLNPKDVKAAPEEILESPPNELFYKGHMMVPATRMEKKSHQVQDMEYIISSLTRKVNFLDKLITEKDVRLAGMSQEILRLRQANR